MNILVTEGLFNRKIIEEHYYLVKQFLNSFNILTLKHFGTVHDHHRFPIHLNYRDARWYTKSFSEDRLLVFVLVSSCYSFLCVCQSGYFFSFFSVSTFCLQFPDVHEFKVFFYFIPPFFRSPSAFPP